MNDETVAGIDIPFPEAGDKQLKISVGACRLRIKPGDGPAWVSGSYRNPSGALPCRIFQEGGTARITQEPNWSEALGRIGSLPATFDLVLGKGEPYTLTLETGASECEIDLGGLPIVRLAIKQGAGKLAIDFSAPNPSEMASLSLSSGASGVDLTGLGNANCSELSVEGGAAAYGLDFRGDLRRDCRVKITAAMSSVELRTPGSTAAKITSESVLGSVDVGDGFMKKEGAFWTEAALAGRTPALTIHANLTLGSLRIRT